ncbi:MAG TPA: YdbH domain-containing protein [Asticcacaulis sp.]|nr:YdbH domain-containing protein [Asticcacaulis sp.]
MTPPISLTDDEALWFPVSMSGGDSFSRPTGIDGAPLPDRDNGGDDDDGVGTPRQRQGGPRPPRRGGVRASSWLWLTLWGATAASVLVYAARREIAAEIVQGWLAGQGARARVHFDVLSLKHAEGSLLVGDKDRPEFSLDRFDMDYRLTPFARGGLPLAQVTRVHLVHPVIQASLQHGQLHFGALDKLVNGMLSAPPSRAPPPQDIIVEDVVARLSTDYGLLRGRGALSLHEGRLAALNFTLPATHLSGPQGEGDLSSAQILARSVTSAQNGEQLHIQARVSGDNIRIGDAAGAVEGGAAVAVADASLGLDLLAPYRKSQAFFDAFTGAGEARLDLHAGQVSASNADARHVDAHLTLAGAVQSGEKAGGFSGAAQLNTQAESLTSGAMRAEQVRLSGDKLALKLNLQAGAAPVMTLSGPVSQHIGRLTEPGLDARDARLDLGRVVLAADDKGAQADFEGRAHIGAVTSGDIGLTAVKLTLNGEARSNAATGGWRLAAQGDLDADGRYGGLSAAAQGRPERVPVTAPIVPGQPKPAEPPKEPLDAIVALDRAFERFRLAARGLSLDMAADDAAAPPMVKLRLRNGARFDLNGGGQARLDAGKTGVVYDTAGQGAFAVTLGGPDLPQAKLDVARLDASGAGDWSLSAHGDVAPVVGAQFDGHGRFATTSDGLVAILSEPATFTAASAEIGDHLEHLSASLTPAKAPLLALSPQGWRSEAGFSDLSLSAPNEQAAFAGGGGTFAAYALPGADATGLKADLSAGLVSDTLTGDQKRFHPLQITGALTQDARAMTGRFFAATPNAKDADGKPLPVAQLDLVNSVTGGEGTLKIHTYGLDFAPGGLQPADLTPLTAAARDVSGKAVFDGGFAWDAKTVTSGGTLTLDGLNFTAGPANARTLSGKIVFTSLSPLLSDPHQRLSVANIDSGLPLTDLNLGLQFMGDHIALEEAQVMTPGGVVRLEPMDLPMDAKTAINGVVSFDGLDFGKIIAATSLADSMSFDGTLTGKLPFTITDGHVRVANGYMASDRPGRISVKRSAVTGVDATGNVTSEHVDKATAAVAEANARAADAADPNFNPFQDLAYQAMEHIAYDQIDAKVNSKDGVLDNSFHIKGRFDPPQQQKATISLFDYLRGTWMQKPITLPSGTPVELYLEVPVNLDELLGDLAQFGAPAPQPAPSPAEKP